MSITKLRWAMALGLAAGLTWTSAHAQDMAWRPAATPVPQAAPPSGPLAAIGRPIALEEYGSTPLLPPLPSANPDFKQAPHADEIPVTSGPEAVVLRAQATEPPPVPPPGAPPVPPPYTVDPTVRIEEPIGKGGGFWDKNGGWAGKNCHFQSDHSFDQMISPVSNPFFFEDPRSLTEVRPIFLIQRAPNSNSVFNGGYSGFFGLQGSVALTDCWSVVVNELGLVFLHPDNPSDGIDRETGLSQFDIGPKWTFYRNQNTNTVAAAGLTFEIPTSSTAYQNTGTLGLDPYVTVAQSFGHLPQGWGSFNFIGEAGYSFATDSQRTDFFHTSLHLDYDVANLHRIYPLMEVNWFYTTKRGDANDLPFEGGDLVNFGSRDLANRNLVTMDLGARYKFREWLQFGGAFEFPLSSTKGGIEEYRFLFDVIFKY